MRLIDADKFCDIIDDKCLRLAKKLGYKSYKELSENMKWYWDGISYAVGVVLDMPTVDAVEVTRCKDCIHRPLMVWNEANGDFDVRAPEVDGKEDWRCPCLIEDDPYYSWSPNDNWFCGNGKRRESDADAEGKG